MNENDNRHDGEPDAIENLLRQHFEATASDPVDVGQYTWRLVAPRLASDTERKLSMEIQDPEAPVLTFSSPENILDPMRGDPRKTRWRGMTVSAAELIVVLLIGAFFFVLHAPHPAGPVSGNPNQVSQETLRSVSMDSPDDG